MVGQRSHPALGLEKVALMSAKHAKIARFVGGLSSIEELEFLVKAARERMHQIRLEANERAAAAQEAKWSAVRRAKKGHYAVVHAAVEPVRILVAPPGKTIAMWQAATMRQGLVLTVAAVQPRAKRVWLANQDSGETYCMTPRELSVLDVRIYPDEMTAQIAAAGQRSGL